jgi:hypothetical protein
MLQSATKSEIIKKSILNSFSTDPRSIEGIASKVRVSRQDKKLDEVSLKILALTFNMAGGLPSSEKEID